MSINYELYFYVIIINIRVMQWDYNEYDFYVHGYRCRVEMQHFVNLHSTKELIALKFCTIMPVRRVYKLVYKLTIIPHAYAYLQYIYYMGLQHYYYNYIIIII